MKNLQEQYNLILEGKGDKQHMLKQMRMLFPQYITQYHDFNTAASILKSKQIISENTKKPNNTSDFDIMKWKRNISESTEIKAESKKIAKEVEDAKDKTFENDESEKDITKQIDKLDFNQVLKGFYAEMGDEKNTSKSVEDLKKIVIKNLIKDPMYYTKKGMFGLKGVGFTDEVPSLGKPKDSKGKFKSSGYGDLDIDKVVEKVKANVKDTLSDKEAKITMPKKVKEMEIKPKNSKGVKKFALPGKEKKIKLKLDENETFNPNKMQGKEDFQNSIISDIELSYPDLIESENWEELKKKIEQNWPSLDAELVVQYWSSPDFSYSNEDDKDDEIDFWNDGETDPAGGYGPSSHIEEISKISLLEFFGMQPHQTSPDKEGENAPTKESPPSSDINNEYERPMWTWEGADWFDFFMKKINNADESMDYFPPLDDTEFYANEIQELINDFEGEKHITYAEAEKLAEEMAEYSNNIK